MSKGNNAIGFFDSGVGGITIWNEVTKLLPLKSTIYLADSVHAPYGVRSAEEIVSLSLRNTSFLLSKGAKLIVVACNTATTQAIAVLRQKFDVPFIGIEPAIKPAAGKSKSGCIGVLATRGTLESEHFNHTKERYSGETRVILRDGDGIVKLIENGGADTPEMVGLLQEHLSVFQHESIDHLVLGCTHYPLVKKAIKKLLNSDITIVDSGYAVAKQCKRILGENDMLVIENTKPEHHFYTNGKPEVLQNALISLGYKNSDIYQLPTP